MLGPKANRVRPGGCGMRHQLILAVAVAAMFGALPALAHQRDPSKALNCPELRQSRMEALESRIELLRSRLDGLDARLASFDTDRREALDGVKASIESAVHDASLSQPELDAAVAAALARADERARTMAASVGAAQEEAKSVRGQLGVLEQQLHTLARGGKAASDRG